MIPRMVGINWNVLLFHVFISVVGTFLNTLKFVVKDCDPITGEPDDIQGYDDEYVVSIFSGYSSILMRGNTLC